MRRSLVLAVWVVLGCGGSQPSEMGVATASEAETSRRDTALRATETETETSRRDTALRATEAETETETEASLRDTALRATETETQTESATATATATGAAAPEHAAAPCRVRSLYVEYDRENEPPAPPVRSEVLVERFVDDWSERDVCDRAFDDYARRPMRCAPRARSRSEVRGDVLAPNRVLVGTRDGESLDVTFDDRGRTNRIDWDPTASGSFDYAFVYEYACSE